MVKRVFFIIISTLVLPSLVGAEDFDEIQKSELDVFTLSGYTEAGERSTAEDYEEEDTDDDYSYRNYHLKFGQKVSDRLSYDISSGLEQNFYDFNDSNNDKKRAYVKLSCEKLFLEGDLVLSLDLKYRYTDYRHKDDKEQEAVRFAFRYGF